jgi:hypothetical protein
MVYISSFSSYRCQRRSASVCQLQHFEIHLYVYWPPLWSSGQSSCLQIQRPRFDSRCYQILWELVGLERGALSFVNTIEELLEIKSNGSDLENRDNGRRDSSRWQRGTLYPQQLTLTSSTSGDRSVGLLRSRTQALEFTLVFIYMSISSRLLLYLYMLLNSSFF